VIFDLDDTLIDWANPTVSREIFYRPGFDRMHQFLMKSGYKLPSTDEFFKIIDQAILVMWAQAKNNWRITSLGQILAQVIIDFGHEVKDLDVDLALRIFDWGPRPGVVLFPDTLPVLNDLQGRGYPVGLLTNSFLPMWMRDSELEAYELLEYLDTRISAADVGYLKPHPIIYHALLEKLEVTAERTIFVGDRPKNDIAGANDAGMISVLIDPPHLNHELNGIVPDFTINRLGQLLPILENLESDFNR